jgi:pyruvate,water dikinase
MLPAFPRLMRRLVPIWRDEMHPEYKAFVSELKAKNATRMSTDELWGTSQEIVDAAMYYITALLFATMGASAGSEMLLAKVYDKLAKQAGDPPATTFLMGWNNIPSQADKSLYDLATYCRERPELANFIQKTDSGELVDLLRDKKIPNGIEPAPWKEFKARFVNHLESYGYIIYQLDFAENLPLDRPEPMLQNIKMYLRGEGINPHERQQASEARRINAAETVRGRLRGFRRWAFNKALRFGQGLAEIREDALAEIGLGYPKLREMLRELGQRFVKAGMIEVVDDIFWLEKGEIDSLVAGMQNGKATGSLRPFVKERKTNWEKFKTQTPPTMIPMKKRIWGIKTDTYTPKAADAHTNDTLIGAPTSPGVVTAQACVLHGPEDFDKMRTGHVLVAGTTTPAWTPLFSMASAVVTDIGGPLSHGSIVAREYGIPAVMGTGVATIRIHDWQTITVDGNAGKVVLTDEGE